MIINDTTLEKAFVSFSNFIQSKEAKPFTLFADSQYLKDEEHYKYEIHEQANNYLNYKSWLLDDIGTGKIQEKIATALSTRADKAANNLVDWRKQTSFKERETSSMLEKTFFEFYNNANSNESVFQSLLAEKLDYQSIAYLFFIKDMNQFMPISQVRFDRIFQLLGLVNFKTRGKASWANYYTYNSIIAKAHSFLQTKDKGATLLDAHSFLWTLDIVGLSYSIPPVKINIIHSSPTNTGLTFRKDDAVIKTNVAKISEEDEATAFPEGKDRYITHRKKERNATLVRVAKEQRLLVDPELRCQACNFSFVQIYGQQGQGFIEAHHVFPISELREETVTRIEDLAMVCSNCHRMLHRKRPWLSITQLKELLLHTK